MKGLCTKIGPDPSRHVGDSGEHAYLECNHSICSLQYNFTHDLTNFMVFCDETLAKAKYLEVARRMKAYEDNKYEAWKESTYQILHSLLKRSLLINTHVPVVNHANLNLADVAKAKYLEVARRMKAYEDNKYEAWKESTYQILHSLLKRSLLINTHVPVVNHANLNLADVAKAKYLEVARRMKAYEDNKYEAWKESTDQILHSLLKRSLLINTHVPAVNYANLNFADVVNAVFFILLIFLKHMKGCGIEGRQ
ncbi:uncharacterized protein LOC134935612 [Pseudophryne corroboree]|uniref:uncharacterized protein LOC134935612 n=1 Tax=Pseudophryne corroboree TaxID=495146 RepID=UPI003081F0B1